MSNILPDTPYVLINVASNKAVTLKDGSVVGITGHGDKDQQWKFEAVEGQTSVFRIVHPGEDAILAAAHGRAAVEASPSGTAETIWKIQAEGEAFRIFESHDEGRSLELLDDGNFAPGNKISVGQLSKDAKTQLWRIEQVKAPEDMKKSELKQPDV